MAAWASSIICSEHLWCYHWQYSMSVGKNKKTRWRYSMTFHSVLFISFIFQHSSLLNLLYLPASDLDHIFNFLHSNLRKKKKKKRRSSDSWSSCLKNKVWHSKRLTEHRLGSCSIIRASPNTDLSQTIYTSHFLCLKSPNSSLPGQRLAACSGVQTWAKRQQVR